MDFPFVKYCNVCLRVKKNRKQIYDVYKFHCGLCNESSYGGCVTHLNARTGEHI